MKFIIILLVTLSLNSKLNAQSVKCEDLMQFLVTYGEEDEIPSYYLNSSWLYGVTAYTYNDVIYVVAEIKANEYSYNTNKYIFCGISTLDWMLFQLGDSETFSFGERFHKYIINYKCNCY